jgi:hypothetical protein
MKKLSFLLVLLPFSALSQSQKDYEQAFVRFMNYYNKDQTDKICRFFPDDPERKEECFWKQIRERTNNLDAYGSITSYRYLGIDTTDPERVRVFKVQYSKAGKKAMSFTLSKTSNAEAATKEPFVFGTFRFITSSDGIDKMLSKAK